MKNCKQCKVLIPFFPSIDREAIYLDGENGGMYFCDSQCEAKYLMWKDFRDNDPIIKKINRLTK